LPQGMGSRTLDAAPAGSLRRASALSDWSSTRPARDSGQPALSQVAPLSDLTCLPAQTLLATRSTSCSLRSSPPPSPRPRCQQPRARASAAPLVGSAAWSRELRCVAPMSHHVATMHEEGFPHNERKAACSYACHRAQYAIHERSASDQRVTCNGKSDEGSSDIHSPPVSADIEPMSSRQGWRRTTSG
jgi:hypothetical protein